jgi:hypothetical protein
MAAGELVRRKVILFLEFEEPRERPRTTLRTLGKTAFAILILGLVAGCGKKSAFTASVPPLSPEDTTSTPPISPEDTTSTPPISPVDTSTAPPPAPADSTADRHEFRIMNLGVRFGEWDRSTNRAGDFLFVPNVTKVFLEFGARVSNGTGGFKELPTFEYRIVKDAWVTAVAEGRVVRFVYQEDTRDYEFFVRSIEDPDFGVGYDHVIDPRVGADSRVSPGDTLGHPGTWDATLGRFEIMINRESDRRSYCPFVFFDPLTAPEFEGRVRRFITDWETFKNDTSVYNGITEAQAGCGMESMLTY